MNNNMNEYSKYTIYELYDEYFKLDNEANKEALKALGNEIKTRFNITEDVEVNDSFIKKLYSPYFHGNSQDIINNNLAERIERLGAVVLDSLIIGIPFFIGIFLFIGFNRYINWVTQNLFVSQITLFSIGQLLF